MPEETKKPRRGRPRVLKESKVQAHTAIVEEPVPIVETVATPEPEILVPKEDPVIQDVPSGYITGFRPGKFLIKAYRGKERLKRGEKHYFVNARISKSDYEGHVKVHNERLAEIEDEHLTLETKLSKNKKQKSKTNNKKSIKSKK